MYLLSLCAAPLAHAQSMKVKVVQNSSTVERRFSSWIGGSILASLVSHMCLCALCVSSVLTEMYTISIDVDFLLTPIPRPFPCTLFPPLPSRLTSSSPAPPIPCPSPLIPSSSFRVPSSRCGSPNKITRKEARTLLRRSALNSLSKKKCS